MDRWQTPFGAWVRTYGAARLGRTLGLSGPIPVYQWLGGSTAPRPAVALRIVALSRARVTLEAIYGQRYRVRGRSDATPRP